MKMPIVNWAMPKAFWLLPIWTIAMLLMAWGLKQKRRRLTFWLSGEDVTRWWQRARQRAFLVGAATLILTVAIARPRYFAGKVTVPAQGADVVVCLDVSHSMLCNDIKPSRLEFAQTLVANLLNNLLPGDRVGFVVFGGSGFPLCPLTHDRGIIQTYLSLLEPSVMAHNPTTYIAEGLNASLKLLQRQKQREQRGGVIILLSDGEDQDSDWRGAASACAKAGVPVFVFPIGTQRGAPVLEVTEQGATHGYKRDLNGNIVVSKLRLETLQTIARKTGGKIYLPKDGQQEVRAFLNDLSAYRQRVWTKQVAQWRELFPLLVAVSVLLLIAETWTSRRLGGRFS